MVGTSIDLDLITDIALRGVRRANVFSVLGTNLIDRATVADVRAPALIRRSVIPDELAEKEFEGIRGHFRQWVVCQSLCELAEAIDVFLISVHNTLVLLSHHRAIEIGSRRKQREFPRVGMKEKLERLHTLIGLDRIFIDHIVSVANARKFIAHYLGLVPPLNQIGSDGFEVSWLGHDVVVQMQSHGEVTIARDTKGPIHSLKRR